MRQEKSVLPLPKGAREYDEHGARVSPAYATARGATQVSRASPPRSVAPASRPPPKLKARQVPRALQPVLLRMSLLPETRLRRFFARSPEPGKERQLAKPHRSEQTSPKA